MLHKYREKYHFLVPLSLFLALKSFKEVRSNHNASPTLSLHSEQHNNFVAELIWKCQNINLVSKLYEAEYSLVD